MSRRGDNIHKRKDGRWEGRYITSRDENGKAKYASVYAKTYTDVKLKLTQAMIGTEDAVSQPILFKNVLQLWLDDKKITVKKSTYSKYEFLINKHIIPALGNRKINNLSASEMNCFLNDLLTGNGRKKGLSASYVRSIAIILSSAYEYGVNEGICKKLKNPVFKPSIQKKEPPVLSETEYKNLIRFLCSADDINAVYLGVLIALFTGLRIGEICALKWDDIDTKNGIIMVNSTVSRSGGLYTIDTPKTRASCRSIPINYILLKHLKSFPKTGTHVLTQGDTFMIPRTFENQYKTLLNQAQIRVVNFHTLRHTFATRCIESGMKPVVIQRLMGHTNIQITLNTYTSIFNKYKESEITKVNNYYLENNIITDTHKQISDYSVVVIEE